MQWAPLLMAYASLFFLSLMDNARGPLFPSILNFFHLTNAEGSLFFALGTATQFITTLLGPPWWLKKWSLVVNFRLFTAAQIIGYLVVGFAGLSGSQFAYPIALVGIAIFGISLGGLGVVQNTLVACAAPNGLRHRAFSGLHGMYGLSSLLAPIGVTILFSFGLLWYHWFLLAGLIPILIGVASFFQPPLEIPPEISLKHEKTRFTKAQWTVAIWLGLYVMTEVMISSRLVLYARRDLHFTQADADDLLSLFFFLLMMGRLLSAFFTLRSSYRMLLLISASCSFVCFTLGLMVNPLFLAICGATMSVFFPTVMSLVSDEFPGALTQSMTLAMALDGLGVTLMHGGVGILSDHFGLHLALYTGPVLLAVITVLLLLSKNQFTSRTSTSSRRKTQVS